MSQQALHTDIDVPADNDIKSLFSRFSALSSTPRYQEIVRDDNADRAVRRWPLLAEILIDPAGAEPPGA